LLLGELLLRFLLVAFRFVRGNWFALAGVALAVVIVNTATKENEVIAPVEKGVFCFAGESARV